MASHDWDGSRVLEIAAAFLLNPWLPAWLSTRKHQIVRNLTGFRRCRPLTVVKTRQKLATASSRFSVVLGET